MSGINAALLSPVTHIETRAVHGYLYEGGKALVFAEGEESGGVSLRHAAAGIEDHGEARFRADVGWEADRLWRGRTASAVGSRLSAGM